VRKASILGVNSWEDALGVLKPALHTAASEQHLTTEQQKACLNSDPLSRVTHHEGYCVRAPLGKHMGAP
jgi:hypothetical protein